jgi:hypothetical protein
MTISVIDNLMNADGKFLPRSYLVHYWDATAGNLERVETVTVQWGRYGSIDLPAKHTVSTASNAGLMVRSFTLSSHKIAESK